MKRKVLFYTAFYAEWCIIETSATDDRLEEIKTAYCNEPFELSELGAMLPDAVVIADSEHNFAWDRNKGNFDIKVYLDSEVF